MKQVLILCTGNSCRSQMAEALWNHFGADEWQAVSAGSRPAGYVHPLAIRVLAELGLEIAAPRSKSVDEFKGRAFDLVITVCGSAREACPVFPGAVTQLHWPFDDPAEATGTDDDKLRVFRRVRDEIADRIQRFLAS